MFTNCRVSRHQLLQSILVSLGKMLNSKLPRHQELELTRCDYSMCLHRPVKLEFTITPLKLLVGGEVSSLGFGIEKVVSPDSSHTVPVPHICTRKHKLALTFNCFGILTYILKRVLLVLALVLNGDGGVALE